MQPDTIVNAFLREALADRLAGALRPLADYQAQWPGHDALIATEYAAVVAEEATPAGGPARLAVRRIGPFRVIRELGRGGQGMVLLAEDERLHRPVALKVLGEIGASSASALVRFRREAEAASKLDHPHLCAVYEAGIEDGTAYIAMRYVQGETLARRFERERSAADRTLDGRGPTTGSAPPPSADELLLIVEKIARALHVAHEAGIVHRDVKPSNIMITPEGEPVLLDFGIARTESPGGTGVTGTGDVLGTPASMSPEQIDHDLGVVDRRADVWALGVTLYEGLAGAKPFDAPTRTALYHAILRQEPLPLRRRRRGLSRDLGVVVATALAKSPNARYRSAEELAEDLARVRERRPIHAVRPGALVRAARWAQRNPALATSVAAILLALASGLAVSLALLGVARRERDEKAAALVRARVAALGGVAASVGERDPVLRLLLAREAARLDPVHGRRALREALSACRERVRITAHYGVVSVARWSPDGTRVLTGSHDGIARIFDAAGRPLAELRGHEGKILDAAWSSDGTMVVTASDDLTARRWRSDGTPLQTLAGHAEAVIAASFTADGRIRTVSAAGVRRVFSSDGLPSEDTLAAGGEGPTRPVRSPSGELLASIDAAGVLVLERKGAAAVSMSAAPESPVSGVLFTGRGDTLVVARADGSLRLHPDGGAASVLLGRHDAAVTQMSVAPDGGSLLTASRDGTARIWALEAIEPAFLRLPGCDAVLPGPVGRGLQLFTERTRCVVEASDAGLRVVEREELPVTERFLVPPASANGEHLVQRGGRLLVRNARAETTATFAGDWAPAPTRVLASPVAPHFVLGDDAGRWRFVDASSGHLGPAWSARPYRGFLGAERLLSAERDGVTISRPGGEIVARHPLPEHEVGDDLHDVAASPDGRSIAFRTAWHWLVVAGEGLEAPLVRRVGASVKGGLSWSPSGRQLLAGTGNNGVQLLDVTTGKMRALGPLGATAIGAFLGEHRAVTLDGSGVLKVWDLTTDALLDVVPLGDAGFGAIHLDSEGGWIHVVTKSGVFALRAHEAQLLAAAESRALRPLTLEERVDLGEILGADNALEIEAQRWVRAQWGQTPGRAAMAARAEADHELGATLRPRVLRFLDGIPEPLAILNTLSWATLKQPGASPERCAEARRAAEILVRCSPASGAWLNTLGIAHYRCGDFASAWETLRRSDVMNRRQVDPLGTGEDLAVLALVEHRLGRSPDATITRLRGLIAARPLSSDERSFVREAEEELGLALVQPR